MIFRKLNLSLKLVLLALMLTIIACTSYDLGDQFTSRRIERQDHEFCISKKLDFDNPSDLRTKIYWRCRIELTKHRFMHDAKLPEEIRQNRIIKNLLIKLAVKFETARKDNLEKTNGELEEIDHRNCRFQGFNLNTLDQQKVEDYFGCRRRIIDKRSKTLSAKELKKLEKSTNRYNLGYIVDERLNKKAEFTEIVARDYPFCLEINILNPNFIKCKKAQDATNTCLKSIKDQEIKREIDQRVKCHKDVTKILPDSYVKEDSIPENKLLLEKDFNIDIEKMLVLAGSSQNNLEENNKSLTLKEQKTAITPINNSLPVNDKKESSQNTQNKESPVAEITEQPQLEAEAIKKDINSFKGLYSTFELNILRQKYLDQCYIEITNSMTKFRTSLEEKCYLISENWNKIY